MTPVEAMAVAFCLEDGYAPYDLEPGDADGIDGHNRKGEPCHYLWRHYTRFVLAALRALRENVSEEMVESTGIFNKLASKAVITAALLAAEQSGSLTDGERG